MADSVKVQAMHKLAEILGAIPELGSAHRWQGKPTDLDQVKTPARLHKNKSLFST